MSFFKPLKLILVLALMASLLPGAWFKRKKYENPITKDTEQPDKVLYDKAIKDIERGRYEVARLTLNTLMNTYDTSEYMAKSKLAIADSWMREGGTHGMAQAEAEYKDFILFYPTMEESAEAQEKVCMIHYRQMEKSDREINHAMRAEDECRNLLQQFPNSKFAPRVAQRLRNIQEVIADGEYRVGLFYFSKRSYPSAANRLEGMVDHFPLYSKADSALFMTGESYGKLGQRFRDKSALAYQKLVRDYPLSSLADKAKQALRDMEKEVPEPDPAAVARMKFEKENYVKPKTMTNVKGLFSKSPDVHAAAKSGNPSMVAYRPNIPVSVPTQEQIAAAQAQQTTGATAEVGATVINGPSDLDKKDDARLSKQPADGKPADPNAPAPAATGSTDPNAPAAPAAASTDPNAKPAAAAASTDGTQTQDQQQDQTSKGKKKKKKQQQQ